MFSSLCGLEYVPQCPPWLSLLESCVYIARFRTAALIFPPFVMCAAMYDTNVLAQQVAVSPMVYFRNVPATALYLMSTVFADDPTRFVLVAAAVMDDYYSSVMNQSPFLDTDHKNGSEIVVVGGGWCAQAAGVATRGQSCRLQNQHSTPRTNLTVLPAAARARSLR